MSHFNSPPFNYASSTPAPTRCPQLSRWQRREIFREMALAELRYQNVDQWRRKRLVQYAATLKLSATEAGRLLEEAQKELNQELLAAGQSAQPVLRYIPEGDMRSQSGRLAVVIGLLLMVMAAVLNNML